MKCEVSICQEAPWNNGRETLTWGWTTSKSAWINIKQRQSRHCNLNLTRSRLCQRTNVHYVWQRARKTISRVMCSECFVHETADVSETVFFPQSESKRLLSAGWDKHTKHYHACKKKSWAIRLFVFYVVMGIIKSRYHQLSLFQIQWKFLPDPLSYLCFSLTWQTRGVKSV